MTFNQHTCISLTCDTCGEGAGEDSTIHFTTRDEATAYVTGTHLDDPYRWVIVGDTTTCGPCARRADCAATGHQWEAEWRKRPPIAGVPYRTRWCNHCSATDYDPPYDELVLFRRLTDAPD